MSRLILDENGKPIKTSTGLLCANNLEPENIKSGVSILGVTGNFTGTNNGVFSQFTVSSNTLTINIDVENVTRIFLTWSGFGSTSLGISTYQVVTMEITKTTNGWCGYYLFYRGNGNWSCNSVSPDSTSQYIYASESNNVLTLTSSVASFSGRFNAGSYDIVKVY